MTKWNPVLLATALIACGGPRTPPAPWSGVPAVDAEVTAAPSADVGAAPATSPPRPATVLDVRACAAGIAPDEQLSITLAYDGAAPSVASCRRIRTVAPLQSKAPRGSTYWEVLRASGEVSYRVTESRSPQCASLEVPPPEPRASGDAGATAHAGGPTTHRRPFAVMRVLPITPDTARIVLHDRPCSGPSAPFAVLEVR